MRSHDPPEGQHAARAEPVGRREAGRNGPSAGSAGQRNGAAGRRGTGAAGPHAAAGPEGVDQRFFHDVYEGEAPWDIGRPQPEVVKLLEGHRFHGPVLDVGCGTGENAILLAMANYHVTAIDLVPRAVEHARKEAHERGIEVDWRVGDVLQLPELVDGLYATILDAGLFHVFSDDDRRRYADALAAVIEPAGHLHIIAFSEKEEGPGGPRRVSRNELEQTFGDGWLLQEMVETRYHIRGREGGARAWRGTWRRKGVRTS